MYLKRFNVRYTLSLALALGGAGLLGVVLYDSTPARAQEQEGVVDEFFQEPEMLPIPEEFPQMVGDEEEIHDEAAELDREPAPATTTFPSTAPVVAPAPDEPAERAPRSDRLRGTRLDSRRRGTPSTTQATTRPAVVNAPGPMSNEDATTQSGAIIAKANGHGILLNFQDASTDAVLDELSAAAGFIVVKEVSPIAGRVTLVSKQPVTSDEAVSLLNTVLKKNGYTAVRQGRVLKIMEFSKARKSAIPVRSGRDPEQIEPTDELITQVIPLGNADATQLKEDLAPLINTDQADFSANASSNSLIITDTAANIRRIVPSWGIAATAVKNGSYSKYNDLHSGISVWHD